MLLIQFAKWPVPGKVKTRLAKSVGYERACEIHLALTRQVLHNLRRTTDVQVELWFDSIPEASSDEFKFGKSLWTELEEAGIPIRFQQGDDLGARMYHALSDGLERQSAKKREQKVVIVGSDCPTVDDLYLQLARDRLDQCDLVLGPSDDGGYVLIGVSRINNALLCDTPWGTETVLQTTVQRA
ncbi:MAG: TIGR04282 family arsenosugar biosynthesis glycosyltransferase, partial [Pseudomonadales bacterium]|nr:TIGR04282 family arsenosugar biosynthesis glycosyltransferase [Pseudomonadales bacterium]